LRGAALGQREPYEKRGTRSGRRFNRHLSADEGDPLLLAEQAKPWPVFPLARRQVVAIETAYVVLDDQHHVLAPTVEEYAGARGTRVLRNIVQRLLNRAVARRLDRSGERRPRHGILARM